MAGGEIASLFVSIGAKTDDLQSGLSGAEGKLKGFMSSAGGLAGMAAGGFGMAVAAPILSAIGGGFSAITEGVMGTNAQLESSATSWGVLLGGADEAQAKISELFQFGATTPFEFGEVDKAARLLQTFGGNALNTTETLKMVGDGAAATGYGFQDVAFWTARLYDAMQNGQPIGEAMANLQQMGIVSGETRNKIEQLQKEGAKGPELWNTYAQSQQRFSGMMEQQSATFSGRLSTMKDSLNMFLATAGKPIFDLASTGLEKFNGLLASPALAQFASTFSTQVATALQNFFNLIQQAGPYIGQIGAAFMAIAGPLQQFYMNVTPIGAVIATLTGQSSLLATAFQGAMAVIIPLAQQFAAAFMANMPAIMALWTQLQALWVQIQPAVTVLAGIIGGILVGAIGLLMGVLGGLIGAFTGALPGAIQAVSGAITLLSGTFEVISAVVTGVVGIVVNLLQGDFTGAWQAAQNMVGGVASGIVNIVTGMGTMIQGVFTAFIGGVIGGVSGFISTIVGFFQSLYMTLVGGSIVPDMCTAIVSTFTNFISDVVSAVTTFVSDVISFFTNLANDARTKAEELKTNVTTAFTNLITEATTAVTTFVTDITTKFGNLATDALTKANEIKTNVVNAFTNLATEAGQKITNLGTEITNTLGGLVSTAASKAGEIGTAIVNGIANAISNGLGAVTAAARGLAQSALDAALGALGIKSPSKEFYSIGEYVVQGFVNGMRDNSGDVSKAVNDVFAPSVIGKSPSLTGGPGVSGPGIARLGGGPSITVPITVMGTITAERDLQEKIIGAVQNAQRLGRV